MGWDALHGRGKAVHQVDISRLIGTWVESTCMAVNQLKLCTHPLSKVLVFSDDDDVNLLVHPYSAVQAGARICQGLGARAYRNAAFLISGGKGL